MEYLLLYNLDGEIVSLLREFKGELHDGIFNNELRYVEVGADVYRELSKKYDYKITFKKGVEINKLLTIEQFNFELLPPPPPPKPNKEKLLATALMQTELQSIQQEKQTKALAMGLMDTTLSNEELRKQVLALSKAIFELTIKNK